MRSTIFSAVLMVPLITAPHAATRPSGAGEPLASLEDCWKQCIRNAYADQPSQQSRAASQINALDTCKEHEDAYVAAVMATRSADEEAALREGRGLASKAKAWAASILGYVMDPISSWLHASGR